MKPVRPVPLKAFVRGPECGFGREQDGTAPQFGEKRGRLALFFEFIRNEQSVAVIDRKQACVERPMMEFAESHSVAGAVILRYREWDDVCGFGGGHALDGDDTVPARRAGEIVQSHYDAPEKRAASRPRKGAGLGGGDLEQVLDSMAARIGTGCGPEDTGIVREMIPDQGFADRLAVDRIEKKGEEVVVESAESDVFLDLRH